MSIEENTLDQSAEGPETATEGAAKEVDEGFNLDELADEPETAEEGDGGEEEAGDDAEDDEGDGGEPDDELVEISLNGKTYKVPKELEAFSSMQKDYTQKTQTLAEEKRALESDKQWINQTKQITTDELKAVAALQTLDEQMQQFQAINWQELRQNDWAGATDKWQEYQQLKDLHGQWNNHLGQLRQVRTGQEQQAIAKRLNETVQYAQKNIRGWSEELAEKLVDFAVEVGIPRDNLKREMSPQVLNLLHLAYVGKNATAKIPSKTAPAAKATQPLKTVQSKSSPKPVGDLSKLSMDAYVAARQKGVGG